MDGIDSSSSSPPQPPPEPVDSGSSGGGGGVDASSSSSSTSSPDAASGSSGNAGAAAAATPSPEFSSRWNADAFGAANDSVEAAKSTGGASASTRGASTLALNTDSFEPAKASGGGPNLTGASTGAPSAAASGTADQAAQAGANPQQLAAARQPDPPQADPQTRQRVEDEITRRLNGQGNAHDVADRMARALGNGDMRRGMDILERGLRNNNLNVGLAGISGATGGPRTQATLDALQRDMGTATGRNLDTVIDNDNGALAANRGAPDDRQLAALREIGNLGSQLGIKMDVVSHSNGFNTLRTYLGENPNARMGNITLVNPNIPPNFQDTQRGFQAMVNQSDRVRLVTSIADGVVPLSGAGRNGSGSVWQQQINAAAAAGVPDITVLNRAGHGVDSVADQIGRPRPNLDFARDPNTGRTVPRDPAAWRQLDFTWSPENGFRHIQPRPSPFPPIGRAA